MSISPTSTAAGTADGRPIVHMAAEHDPGVVAVDPPLDTLLPWGGLRRGQTVAVAGSTSLALALVARASREGAWSAVVGRPTLGLAAVQEAGIDLRRFVSVPRPGDRWTEVVATLLDAVDVLVLELPSTVPVAIARRVQARVRGRGVVLLTLQPPGAPVLERTPLRLTVAGQRTDGLGVGHGYVHRRWVQVRVEGQGTAARSQISTLGLPIATGGSPSETTALVSTRVVLEAG